MRIGKLAKQVGVSVDTLRFYEERGLITSQRSANGYRCYSEETAQLVSYIKQAQKLGFSLAEIGENIPLLWNQSTLSNESLEGLFRQKIDLLNLRISEMLALRDALESPAKQICPLMIPASASKEAQLV